MKVSKAIEILNDGIKDYKEPAIYDFQRAIKLGIEALKAIKAYRPYDDCFFFKPLPGETPEEEV